MAAGSWLVIEELLERGDPAFVDELRACEDAARLAAFAASWHADRRPAARRFLLEYLRRPLNAYHHEGLVKRLFKVAEKAGDLGAVNDTIPCLIGKIYYVRVFRTKNPPQLFTRFGFLCVYYNRSGQ